MRNQRIFVNGLFSSLRFILARVPQGSVYINDLADYLHGMARLFADDTSLSFSSNNLAFTEHILNTDLVKKNIKRMGKEMLS